VVTVLGTSTLAVGVIERITEATAAIPKIFSGALSDWFGKRKGLAVLAAKSFEDDADLRLRRECRLVADRISLTVSSALCGACLSRGLIVSHLAVTMSRKLCPTQSAQSVR
jgi:hypothetical protein